MAFIRPYKPSDFEATSHICRATLPPSLSGSASAARLAPYIWTHQYTLLSPGTCFVLDDGKGTAVGYCIGCPDVSSFAAAYGTYTSRVLDPSPEIRTVEELSLSSSEGEGEEEEDAAEKETELRMTKWAYRVEDSLLSGNRDVLADGYTATMHIDLLAPWQGQGWGGKLIQRFVESVKMENPETKGIWIGVAEDNARVVPFYEKQGFFVAEGGKGCIRMVYDFGR